MTVKYSQGGFITAGTTVYAIPFQKDVASDALVTSLIAVAMNLGLDDTHMDEFVSKAIGIARDLGAYAKKYESYVKLAYNIKENRGELG